MPTLESEKSTTSPMTDVKKVVSSHSRGIGSSLKTEVKYSVATNREAIKEFETRIGTLKR